MGYATQLALNDAYKTYTDAFRGGSQQAVTAAFGDYKKAYDKNEAERPLRDEMEQMAKDMETIANARMNTPVDITGRGFNPDYATREAQIAAQMEKKWPGWYQGYLDWKIYELSGGQPMWYRDLKDAAATTLDVALQVLPFMPYIRGAGGVVRPWVATPGRAPAAAPVPVPTPSIPVRPPAPAPVPVPTTAAGQWWQARQQSQAPPTPTVSSQTIWQRYNQQLQNPPPMVPSIDVRFPTTTPKAPPAQPTSMVPPPVATPGACPPGHFWDGKQCRGSIGPMPSGIPGGVATPGGGGGVPFAMGRIRIVNLG